MGVAESVALLREVMSAQMDEVDPLEMAVTAALGCVSAIDVYGPAASAAPVDVDQTAVLEPIRPIVAKGAVISAWHQQLLHDAGIVRVNVIPQPRVVVLGVGTSAKAARTLALVSTIRLAGALALPVTDTNAESLMDAIEDQCGRADLVLVCEDADAKTEVSAQLVAAADRAFAVWDQAHLPSVTLAHVGSPQIPVLVVPAEPREQLLVFGLVIAPMIARLQGRIEMSRPAPTSLPVPESHVSVGHASTAEMLGTVSSLKAAMAQVRARLRPVDDAPHTPIPAQLVVEVSDDTGAMLTFPLPSPPAPDS